MRGISSGYDNACTKAKQRACSSRSDAGSAADQQSDLTSEVHFS